MHQKYATKYGFSSYLRFPNESKMNLKNEEEETLDSFVEIDNFSNRKFQSHYVPKSKCFDQDLQRTESQIYTSKNVVQQNIQQIQNLELEEEISTDSNLFLCNQIDVYFHIAFSTKNGDLLVNLQKLNTVKKFRFDKSTPIYMIQEFVEENYLPKNAQIIKLCQLEKNCQQKEDFKLYSLQELTNTNSIKLCVHCNIDLKQDLADRSLLPVFAKDQMTSPKLYVITRCREEELEEFGNFEIYNDYIKIKFLVPVNLKKANFKQQLKFKKEQLWIDQNLLDGLFQNYQQIPQWSIQLQLFDLSQKTIESMSNNKQQVIRNFQNLFNLELNTLMIDPKTASVTVIFQLILNSIFQKKKIIKKQIEMNSKFKIKRIQPINLLPKIKGLQDSNLKYLRNDKQSQQKQNKNQTKSKNQEKNDEAQKVEFSHQNNYHLISYEFLLLGYSQSYNDFFELFIKNKQNTEQQNISVEILDFFKKKLIKIEECKIQKQIKQQLQLYYELAQKLDDKNHIYIQKFFYQKIIDTTQSKKLEVFSQKEMQLLDEWFIKGKLGYIQCLDFVSEKEQAISLLEEILIIAQNKSDYQVQINEQLINLHKQIAEQEQYKKNYNKALKHFKKCFNSCKEVSKFQGECEIVLQIAQINILLQNYQEPIQLINQYLKTAYKLEKDQQLQFEIQGYKILAECQLKLDNLDEAENYFRNLHELLKRTDEEMMVDVKCQATNQLGKICWINKKFRESGQFFNEYFDNSLKIQPKNRETIGQARISLALVKGFSEYHDYVDYLYMSKNPIDDIIKFKKTGKFSQFNFNNETIKKQSNILKTKRL